MVVEMEGWRRLLSLLAVARKGMGMRTGVNEDVRRGVEGEVCCDIVVI